MTPDAERLFLEAVELAPLERRIFVLEHCSTDELRREVESLLVGDDSAESFLKSAVVEAASSLQQLTDQPASPNIGLWRITRVLGRGGMGVVYAAERSDGLFSQQVAIKVIQRRPDLASLVARFESERRILAGLSHPNIAQLFDGGTSSDGLPYLVMEFVDGVPISDYVRAHSLGVRQTVELFLAVCSGVEHAHQHSIVHRDIKPGNIMVTADGVVKLLDFGIARMMSDGAPSADTGTMTLTLEYSSPEQVRGEPVTTATDVYSLGGVLYQLLTGATPLQLGHAPLEDCLRAILEKEPYNPLDLRPAMGRDLAQIVLRALRKEPGRRYPSAQALRFDLDRYRRGLPVEARGTSPFYLTSRFLRRRWLPLTAAALAVGSVTLAAIAVMGYRAAQWHPMPGERHAIVVSDFVNHGKDPAFDLTLRKALEIGLGQSPYVSVLPQPRVEETLQMMRRQADQNLSQPVAREVCERNGGQAVIAGEIVSVGSHYLIILDALDCASGNAISRAKTEAVSKEDVLKSLGRATEQLRQQLGESLRSVQQFDVPLEQATTKSFDALVAYSKANVLASSANTADAIPLFDRAIELDPNFALAFMGRGAVLYSLNETKRAAEDYEKAYALSEGVTERERLRITADYYTAVDQNLERAADTYKVWTRLYPRDNVPWENLAHAYIRMGRYKEAVEAAQHAPILDPKSVNGYVKLARAQKKANLYEDAKKTCQEAFGHSLDSWHLHDILLQIAYAQRDTAAMVREAEWGRGKSTENETLDNEGWAAASEGRIQFARGMFRAAIESARRERLEDSIASLQADESQAYWFAGLLGEARMAAEKVPVDQEIEVSTQAGIVAAFSGGTAYAAKVITRLRSEPRRSLLRDQVDIPLLKAAMALYRNKPAEAVKLLEPTQVYELRDYIIPFLRGRAYLDAKIPEQAVTEYRAITDNPGIDPVSPMYPLAFLGLGRAYRLQGKRTESRAAYERFLDLWKDADVNVPVLQAARREYARLNFK